MSYSKLILRDSAEIVWPLDDITSESTQSAAINFMNPDQYSYSASVYPDHTDLLQTPIVFGGGTLLSFTSSAVGMSIPALDRFSELYDNRDSFMSLWFQTNYLGKEEYPIFKKRGYDKIGLFIKENYLIFRYGTTASYSEVAIDFADVNEPHHIMVGRNRTTLMIVLDGNSYTSNQGDPVRLEKDENHEDNDYIDFYGPPNGSWNIDTPAIYPNILGPNYAKRHYVYGLGKNTPDSLFYSRGGNLYNFSTIYTERLIDINWDYPDEWRFTDITNLNTNNFGIGPQFYSAPTTYSFDNNLDLSADKYKFSSSVSNTQASYVQIDKLNNKLNSGNSPFMIKFKLDGELPAKYLHQTLFSIGKVSAEDIITFDLYNNDDNYQVRVKATGFSSSATFDVSNVTASPSFYLGMWFNGATELYFCQSGSSIQTASFSYLSASGYGVDPLTGYVPFAPDSLLRIGGAINYDENTFDNVVYNVNQFLGSVERFVVLQNNFTASADFSYLDSYKQPKYEFVYDSTLQRFKVKSYGYGTFNIHSINFSEYIDDDTQRIGANYIKIGYPDVLSSSAVTFQATLLSYSGSTIAGPVTLTQDNYLPFLNNTNIADQYLKFDFEIYSDDSIYYPPRIKYFKMQTFKSTNNSTVLKDDAGPQYTLYPSASSVYLPEIRYTPSVFMTENSGVKIYNTKAEFSENIMAKPLDPRTIEGLRLWLDSRFVNGLNKINVSDDTRVNSWTDLSDLGNNAIQNESASAPVFRSQSLNLLRMNQLDGGEDDNSSFIIPNNATIVTSVDGAVSGTRGIEIIPDGNSIDSYIDMSFNTASITVFPEQSYSVVGTIRLLKPQTGSAQYVDARKIIVYTTDGVTETLSASSVAGDNARGTYSLSAVFTTTASTTGARILFYNGSYDSYDSVYWDNMGLYPFSSSFVNSSGGGVFINEKIQEWVPPLTQSSDSETLKFKSPHYLNAEASISTPYSIYIVGRLYNIGSFISNENNYPPFYIYNNKYYINNEYVPSVSNLINEKNVHSFIGSSNSSKLYINGLEVINSSTTPISFSEINIGKSIFYNFYEIYDGGTPFTSSWSLLVDGGFPSSSFTSVINEFDMINYISNNLQGDISAVVVYSGAHDYQTRTTIENWLKEAFFLYPNIVGAN